MTARFVLIPRRNLVAALCLGLLFTLLQAIGGTQSAHASYLPNPYTFSYSFNCPETYTAGTRNSYYPAFCGPVPPASDPGPSYVRQGTYINLVDSSVAFATGVSNHDSGTNDLNRGLRPAADGSFTLEAWVKSPDYSTENAVVLLGASPSFISQREGALTVGTKEIKTVGGTSYTFWYADVSGWATMFFRFPTSSMSVNQWHWVVVNQDSTNGFELFVDGIPGTPTGSVNDISAPAGVRFVTGGTNGSKQLYFFDDSARRASNGKMLLNGSYQIGAWLGKRWGDQQRNTIGGASFGDIRYTAPSIYSSAATSLTVPTSSPAKLPGTQLLLTSGDTTDGITDESGNQQLQFVNVTTSRANATVTGWSTLQTQASFNLTTTSANVNNATTLTTSGGSGSGAVSFVVNSGPCTISSGNQLTASATGTCVVAATKANDGTYNSTTVTGNITISSTPPEPSPTPTPVVVSVPIPSPPQQSEILSVDPRTCYVGVPTEFVISGRFNEALTNISINGMNLPVNSWRQSESEVAFTFTATQVGEQTIQLYNGSIPLLAVQRVMALSKPVAPLPIDIPKPSENTLPIDIPKTSGNTQPTSSMKKIATLKFSLGASAMTAAQRREIASIVKLIRKSTVTTVLLYGHSDIQPGVDNAKLSEKRAKSVRAAISPLLEGYVLKMGWFAATKPAVKGNSQSAYAENRRVEVWVK